MLLYLLTDPSWDSETPMGVYSTFELAAAAAEKACIRGAIYKFRVDESPHDYGCQWYHSLGGDWIECTRSQVESE